MLHVMHSPIQCFGQQPYFQEGLPACTIPSVGWYVGSDDLTGDFHALRVEVIITATSIMSCCSIVLQQCIEWFAMACSG